LLALIGAHHILHVSRIRAKELHMLFLPIGVKADMKDTNMKYQEELTNNAALK
jgi:hypothetical protein